MDAYPKCPVCGEDLTEEVEEYLCDVLEKVRPYETTTDGESNNIVCPECGKNLIVNCSIELMWNIDEE